MAARRYHTADGKAVPSVTTILSTFDKSDAITHWAWKLGCEGKDYRHEREAAADAGTLAHALIEDHIRRTEIADSTGLADEVVDGALEAFSAYLGWRKTTDLVPYRAEVSLVSERGRYGGTFDALASRDGGRRILVDWKTSKSPHPKFVAQLGAYAGLWMEHNPTEPIHGAACLLFDRTGKGFRAYEYSAEEVLHGFAMFGCLRSAYDELKAIERFYKREAA
jgi:hypothetical protein